MLPGLSCNARNAVDTVSAGGVVAAEAKAVRKPPGYYRELRCRGLASVHEEDSVKPSFDGLGAAVGKEDCVDHSFGGASEAACCKEVVASDPAGYHRWLRCRSQGAADAARKEGCASGPAGQSCGVVPPLGDGSLGVVALLMMPLAIEAGCHRWLRCRSQGAADAVRKEGCASGPAGDHQCCGVVPPLQLQEEGVEDPSTLGRAPRAVRKPPGYYRALRCRSLASLSESGTLLKSETQATDDHGFQSGSPRSPSEASTDVSQEEIEDPSFARDPAGYYRLLRCRCLFSSSQLSP
jgi:hypothetical protein